MLPVATRGRYIKRKGSATCSNVHFHGDPLMCVCFRDSLGITWNFLYYPYIHLLVRHTGANFPSKSKKPNQLSFPDSGVDIVQGQSGPLLRSYRVILKTRYDDPGSVRAVFSSCFLFLKSNQTRKLQNTNKGHR